MALIAATFFSPMPPTASNSPCGRGNLRGGRDFRAEADWAPGGDHPGARQRSWKSGDCDAVWEREFPIGAGPGNILTVYSGKSSGKRLPTSFDLVFRVETLRLRLSSRAEVDASPAASVRGPHPSKIAKGGAAFSE